MMLKLIISLALLGLSAFFNIRLYIDYQNSANMLKKCEEKYNKMLSTTYDKAEQLERARTEALVQLHRADTYMLAPPAIQGDDCGSARIRIDNWIKERHVERQAVDSN